MSVNFTGYKGLSVVDETPLYNGGLALNDNFLIIANKFAELYPRLITNARSVIQVSRGGSAVSSGDNLLAAYTAAKTLDPGGVAVSATNRVTIIVPPGRYDLRNNELTLDTDGIDIIGFGKSRMNRGNMTMVAWGFPSWNVANAQKIKPLTHIFGNGSNVIKITARNLLLKSLHVEQTVNNAANWCIEIDSPNDFDQGFMVDIYATPGSSSNTAISHDRDLINTTIAGYFENVHSTGRVLNVYLLSGYCKNCVGVGPSFGAGADAHSYEASGIFKDCWCGESSFGFRMGQVGIASGYFENCRGYFGSGDVSGYFRRCVSGQGFDAD